MRMSIKEIVYKRM